MGSITYEEHLARYSKERQRRIARGTMRLNAECIVLHDKTVAREYLDRLSPEGQRTIMLEVARQQASASDDYMATTYQEVLASFPAQEQRAIKRGVRFLNARHARLCAQAKPRPKPKASSTTDIATPTNTPTNTKAPLATSSTPPTKLA